MDEPVDYGELGAYLARDARAADASRSARRTTRPGSTTAKAKFLLGWRPRYDLARLIDEACDYERAPDDPRVVWYPG